tara:strand:- start:4384 stop:6117 length:1734 start_codon:yes stop_codon:yes gene_type:complete
MAELSISWATRMNIMDIKKLTLHALPLIAIGAVSACGTESKNAEECNEGCFADAGSADAAGDTRSITVEALGDGEAVLIVNGEACELPCTQAMPLNAEVRLEVQPTLTTSFGEWDRGECARELVCEFTVTQDATLAFSLAVAGEPLSQFAAPDYVGVRGAVIDSVGNFYLTGSTQRKRVFASSSLPGNGEVYEYIIKVSPDGTPLWVREFNETDDGMRGTSLVEGLLALSPDESSLYVAARDVLVPGFGDNFIDHMRLFEVDAATGEDGWHRDIRSYNRSIEPRHLAVGTTGNVHLAGKASENLGAGGVVIETHGSRDSFLISYTGDGELLSGSARNSVGAEDVDIVDGFDLVPDGSGGVYNVNRYIADPFGDRDLQYKIAHFDSSGSLLSEVDTFENVQGIAPTANGGLVIAGFYRDEETAEDLGLPLPEGVDIFLAEVDTEGTPRWIRAIGGARSEAPFGVEVGRDSNIRLTAEVREKGVSDFGNGPLPVIGERDYVTATFSSTGELRWAQVFNIGDDPIYPLITVAALDKVFVIGNFFDQMVGPFGILDAPPHPDTAQGLFNRRGSPYIISYRE